MCLALTAVYYLDLDEPHWAMTLVVVTSFLTVGGVISKGLGCTVSSLLGAIAASLLARHTLNRSWFLLLSMSAQLGFYTWACVHLTNSVAYVFQLAGYAAVIIAFPTVNVTEVSQLQDIVRVRVHEVTVGILCGGMMMMILPSSSNTTALLTALKNIHAQLLEHVNLLWQPETTDTTRTAHEGMIGQIPTINLLRIQAFWSRYRFRQQNARLNALLHQQLRMTSVISSLRYMLLNWSSPSNATRKILEQLLTVLASSQTDVYTVTRIISSLRPTSAADYRHIAFWQRLRYFYRLYLQGSQELHRLQNGVGDRARLPQTLGLAHHIDNAEAMWSGLRTLCILMMIGAWSIALQWDAGADALTLAVIGCIFYSAVVTSFKSLSLLMRTLVLLSLLSFIVKFGLMVRVSDLQQFLPSPFPLLATMQLLKLQMSEFATLWGQLIVFIDSFITVTSPPVYGFADLLNDNPAKIVGIALTWLALAILCLGSDARESRRHVRVLRRDSVDQLSCHPTLSESEFESLVYHHVSQLSSSQGALACHWLLCWGVVLLSCSHVAWQSHDWEPRSDPLSQVRNNCISLLRGVMSECGVQQKSLVATLEELQQIYNSLARHYRPAT